MPEKNSTAARMAREKGVHPQPPPAPEGDAILGPDGLFAAVSDPGLSEDLALKLLQASDVSSEIIVALAKHSGLMNGRKLRLAVVEHRKTPRQVSLPIVRHLFTFDLMRVTLGPAVPADIKRAAEDALIHRLEAVTAGEKLTLARRASGRIAGALLFDAEPRVMHAALENGRITEAHIIRALTGHTASATLVDAICNHPRWSQRREIRIALLRHEKTALARALAIARSLPPTVAREALRGSRLPEVVRKLVLKDLAPPSSG